LIVIYLPEVKEYETGPLNGCSSSSGSGGGGGGTFSSACTLKSPVYQMELHRKLTENE